MSRKDRTYKPVFTTEGGVKLYDKSTYTPKGLTRLRSAVDVAYSGTFHSPEAILAKNFKEALDRINSIQPVKKIDAASISLPPPLTPIEFKRFKAAKLFKKYYTYDVMRSFGKTSIKGLRSEAQCDVIIAIALKLEENIKNKQEKK